VKQVPVMQNYDKLRKDFVQISWQLNEKCDKRYLELGFTVVLCREKIQKPLCILCSQIHSDDVVKRFKLDYSNTFH